ncbi:hypothetical protein F908_02330 [Acinetobacter sp. NIPH 284]|uniref:AAA family ATPase n=1 Tax=Acinetobacter sp. NIPH 284 TaxID=1217704 RepID=UPI0002CF7F17|nr:ATP-binding protein [Acinetobacter sp. NIPH 284]ENW80132.1 hypothetical protein F908_02330 [Acinetobacter sp. NIPH 284]
MKFNFEKLGPLDQAEIVLNKLTVVCGKNNTGKTYITNTIYAFLKDWKTVIDWELSKEVEDNLINKGVAQVDLKNEIINKINGYMSESMGKFKENIPDYFATSSVIFENSRIYFELEINDSWLDVEYEGEIKNKNGKVIISLIKQKKSQYMDIVWFESEGNIPFFVLESFIKKHLLNCCLNNFMPEIFIASAERTGASIFKNELNFNKNQIVSLLTEFEKNGAKKINPYDIVDRFKRSYAISVDDNVDFISYRIEELVKKGRSDFIVENIDLLKKLQDLAGGEYKFNKDMGLYFQPKSAKKIKLGLGEASSAVRSLMIIWFWLCHVAKENSLIMIDEPELNLHPENQRKFARFVVALVNSGVKVFMTTHSDYIIRELNTLVLMNSNYDHIKNVQKKYGYGENEKISCKHINVYSTNEGIKKDSVTGKRNKVLFLDKWDIEENFGIKIKSFDDEIDQMNKIQDNLIYGL